MYKISELENNDFLNDDNCYATFYVYDKSLSEMARFDSVPNTSIEIHIEGGEGYIPHMHICKKSGKNIITRIELLHNKYFREKDDINNTLSRDERVALNDFLSKKIIYSDITEWQFLIMMWNRFNASHTVDPRKYKQPDYTTIDEP